MRRSPWAPIPVLGVVATIALTAAACRGPEPAPAWTPQAPRAAVRAIPGGATVAPMATATATAMAVADRRGTAMAALVPLRGAAVLQTAHLVHEPWLPGLLGQMAPDLSVRADGFTVFSYPGGPSTHGWYQSRLPPGAVAGVLEALMEDGELIEVGRAYTGGDLVLRTGSEGFPDPGDPVSIVVVYARTAEGEARAVFDAADLSRRTGPYLRARRHLATIMAALDAWRSRAAGPVPGYRAAEAESVLGWWNTRVEPYTPDGALLYGTRAPMGVPLGIPARPWPLADDLLAAFDIAAGEPPRTRFLRQEEAEILLRAAPAPRDRRWTALWQAGGGIGGDIETAAPQAPTTLPRGSAAMATPEEDRGAADEATAARQRFLIGVRPVVAGGNQVAFTPIVRDPPPFWLTPTPSAGSARAPEVAAPTPRGHR